MREWRCTLLATGTVQLTAWTPLLRAGILCLVQDGPGMLVLCRKHKKSSYLSYRQFGLVGDAISNKTDLAGLRASILAHHPGPGFPGILPGIRVFSRAAGNYLPTPEISRAGPDQCLIHPTLRSHVRTLATTCGSKTTQL